MDSDVTALAKAIGEVSAVLAGSAIAFAWIYDARFMDGLGLSGLLPADPSQLLYLGLTWSAAVIAVAAALGGIMVLVTGTGLQSLPLWLRYYANVVVGGVLIRDLFGSRPWLVDALVSMAAVTCLLIVVVIVARRVGHPQLLGFVLRSMTFSLVGLAVAASYGMAASDVRRAEEDIPFEREMFPGISIKQVFAYSIDATTEFDIDYDCALLVGVVNDQVVLWRNAHSSIFPAGVVSLERKSTC